MREHSFTLCGEETRKDFLCEVPKPSLDGSVATSCYVILDSTTQTLGGLVVSHRVALWRRVPDPRVRLTPGSWSRFFLEGEK